MNLLFLIFLTTSIVLKILQNQEVMYLNLDLRKLIYNQKLEPFEYILISKR
jgi:hypothetical protein